MNKTPRNVAEVLAFLSSTYPRWNLTPQTIEAYVLLLDDVPLPALQAAALHHASTSQWPPAAAELRQAAFELVDRQRGVPSAEEALAEVLREIRRVGYVGTPEFSHPNVQAAVDAVGGWRLLCMSENFVADRARFIDGYRNIASRHQHQQRQLPQVRGLVEKLAGTMRPALMEGDAPRD